MSGLDIEAIRERSQTVGAAIDLLTTAPNPAHAARAHAAAVASAGDVPALIAEIERYRAAAKRIEDTSPQFRTWTPDVRHDNSTSITLKRCCNGCGERIGDVTEAEMDNGIEGGPLADVRPECPRCNAELWPSVLQALADERGSHAMTLSSFEAFIESMTEERDELTVERDTARAERDDALQVIADLRGAP